MEQIVKQLEELSTYISESDKQNVSVSNANIGWQIDHSLRVMNQIIAALIRSNSDEYKPKFNWRKAYVFLTKRIPRGKVNAPKGILPTEEITESSLHSAIELAKENILLLGNCNPNHFFVHPFFGQVNVRETYVFIEVHTEHHLKIIRDICK
ncbi:MAG: hypothetical protein EBR87_01725 [Cytophagia bacterium]|nr:hypothetical protein [Cytophagia bacterium]